MSTVPNDYRKHILKSILEIFMKTKQILGHKVRLNKILKDKYHMDYMWGHSATKLETNNKENLKNLIYLGILRDTS